MKNLMKKKLLPSAVSVVLAAGIGFSGGAQAIHLAEDGIGQVLLAPMFLADGGYKTKVAIVNTSPTHAVKAKVVFRSAVASIELFDFLCYLTPSDVCRFEIRRNADGQVVMYSTDDSIKSPVAGMSADYPLVNSLEATSATFASIYPVDFPLFLQNLGEGDTASMGHIEVIGAYAVSGTVSGYNGTGEVVHIPIKQGMSKFSLAQIFDTPRTAKEYKTGDYVSAASESTTLEDNSTIVSGAWMNFPYEKDERFREGGNLSPLVASRIRSTDPTWVRLTGSVELVGPDGDRTGYRIPALAGKESLSPIPEGLPSSTSQYDGLVISNPTFDARAGRSAPVTAIGVAFGLLPGSTVTGNKVVEIETALAASSLHQVFEDDSNRKPEAGQKRTQVVVTFPTRYLRTFDYCGTGKSKTTMKDGKDTTPYYPPFQPEGTALYSMTVFDDFENPARITGIPFSGGNSDKCDGTNISDCPLVEVNYFVPSWPVTYFDGPGGSLRARTNDYTKGWFSMAMRAASGQDSKSCPYVGLPVLGFAHQYDLVESSIRNSWFVPLSHK